MNEHGFELERSELNSEAKHKTVAEFKQEEIAYKEIEQELVFGFWSARVCQQSRRICDKEEYQEVYEVFQNELGNLFGGEGFLGEKRLFRKN